MRQRWRGGKEEERQGRGRSGRPQVSLNPKWKQQLSLKAGE